MAGFFGFFNYNKPGPGVKKDEREKTSPFRFLDIYINKFWKLINLNLIYAVVWIIPLGVSWLIATSINSNESIDNLIRILLIMFVLVIFSPLIGPATAGFTYVLRNYSTGSSTFVWMDYIDTAKKNFKQATVLCIIDFLIIGFSVNNITFYFNNSGDNQIMSFISVAYLIIMIFYIFMRYYIYLLLVTFNITIRQLFKNSAILAMAGLGRNLFTSIILLSLIMLIFYNYVVGIVIMLIIGTSTLSFIIVFNSYKPIKTKIVDPYLAKLKEEEDAERPAKVHIDAENSAGEDVPGEDDAEDSVFTDNG